jgi:hypothetical protein
MLQQPQCEDEYGGSDRGQARRAIAINQCHPVTIEQNHAVL